MSSKSEWTAVLTLRFSSSVEAARLERTLAPEAAREVPRARARLSRPRRGMLLLEVSARDTGAFRAALNTYLGWIHLALETSRLARES